MSALAVARGPIHLHHRGPPAHPEEPRGCARPEQVHHQGDDPGPAGLMARPDARAGVAVEILVEERVVAPARVLLELAGPIVAWPQAALVTEENAGQPA